MSPRIIASKRKSTRRRKAWENSAIKEFSKALRHGGEEFGKAYFRTAKVVFDGLGMQASTRPMAARREDIIKMPSEYTEVS